MKTSKDENLISESDSVRTRVVLETGDGLQVSSGDVKLRDETFSFVLVLRFVVFTDVSLDSRCVRF